MESMENRKVRKAAISIGSGDDLRAVLGMRGYARPIVAMVSAAARKRDASIL